MDPLAQPAKPKVAGQRVRACGAGGRVALWMETGTVERFTRAGNPVIAVDAAHGNPATTVTDYDACFRLIDADGRWVRE